MEAWHRRESREWDRLAVLVCQLTAPYREKALTPSEFLGRPLTGTAVATKKESVEG